MTIDSEPGTVRSTASEAEAKLTIAERLQIHRSRRLMSGQSWSEYWGTDPTESLARANIRHVDELSDGEFIDLYLKIASSFK